MAKMYQAISGLLPMLDRMVNIFGRDVNLNASGKKPSGTRWQRGGNSPLWAGFSQYSHKHLVFATGRDNTGAGALLQSACLPIPGYWLVSYLFRRSFIKFLFLDTQLDSRSRWHSSSGK